MSAVSRRTKRVDILQQKIPRNPKYANVQPTIDTGASITKYMKKIEEIRENYRFKKDELFKRMKATTFVQLVIQVAEINQAFDESRREAESLAVGEEGYESDESEGAPPSLAVTEGDFGAPPPSTRSTLEGVISGVGEVDVAEHRSGTQPIESAAILEMPYLLLDVRDREDFEAAHIVGARSYPYTVLSRSVNFETPEMLACRNSTGKIIVVYDEDERIGPRVATTLVERGYDNLFLLSGGLKVASKLFPSGLLAGNNLPAGFNSAGDAATARPVTSQSVSSSRSAAPISAGPLEDFCPDDLLVLQDNLDKALEGRGGSRAGSVASSRFTGGRNTGRSMNSGRPGSTFSTESTDRPPFRP